MAYLTDPLLDQTAGMDVKRFDETWQLPRAPDSQSSGYVCETTTVFLLCVLCLPGRVDVLFFNI